MSNSQTRQDAPLAAWYALGVLTLVTLLAFIDRGVLILQAETIKKAMSLSDLQVGLMQGTGVAIFAGLASFPLGWLADRFDRRYVLMGCLALWSVAVTAGGLAQSYEQLLLSTALVGAGEAGLVPIVYALIPELFGESRRQAANSIYSLASQATGALALALCGALIGWVDAARPLLPVALQGLDTWRLTFFAVTLPAPLMMLLLLTIRLRRTRAEASAVPATSSAAIPVRPANTTELLPHLKKHRQMMVCFYGGIGLAIFGFNCVGSWLAVIYTRIFGQTMQQVGAALGVMALGGTALGFLLSIFGLRWLQRRVGPRTNIRVLWVSLLAAIACFASMIFATDVRQMYAIQGIYIFLITMAAMVYPTALQSLAPNHLRARMSAMMSVLVAGLVAIAPPLVGFVSDHLKDLPNGLIVAANMVAIPALLIAMALLIRAESLYERTTDAVKTIDEASA